MELGDTPTKSLTDVFLSGLETSTSSSLASGRASGETASGEVTGTTSGSSAPSQASGGFTPASPQASSESRPALASGGSAATLSGSGSLGRGQKRSLTDVFLDGLDSSGDLPSQSKLSTPSHLTSRSLLTKVTARNSSAVFKANSGVGLSEGPLRQAVLRHITPLYARF